MNWLGRLLNRRRLEVEMRKELDYHIERQTTSYVEAGLTETEARRKARLEFGGPDQIGEECRDARGTLWVEHIVQDLRLSIRILRKSKAFTVAAVGTLALGIGANAAIFRLLDAVRLSSLPIPNPHRLVLVNLADDTGFRGSITTPYPALTNPMWEQFRDTQQSLAGVLAWSNTGLNIANAGEARFVRGLYVNGDFFRTLQVQPAIGRLFTASTDQRGCGLPGAVISFAFWQREYGGDIAVIGRILNLNYQRTEIIGVSSAGFTGLEVGRSYDVAVPICSEPVLQPRNYLDAGTIWWLTVMGRLNEGQNLETVNAQLRTISPAIFQAALPSNYPAENVKDFLHFQLIAKPASSGVSFLRDQYSDPLLLLLATTGLVLLIACANLANLSLARSSARAHEFAIRLAIGASRGRLIQQLMTEGALLAATGAAAGLALSATLTRVLVASLGTDGDPLFIDTGMNWRMLSFTAVVAGLTCILFGLTPALQATRTGAAEAMKTSGRTLSAGRERFGLRQLLVVAQVALSLVLLVGALLFSGSLRNLMTVDTGFRQKGILTAGIGFSRAHVPVERRVAFKREMVEKIRAIPGVISAAEVDIVPLSGSSQSNTVWPEETNLGERREARFNALGRDYFKTMGIALVAGRDFSDRDTASTDRVAIINQSLARQLGYGVNPIGKRFRRQATPSSPELSFEIIGLVKDTKYASLRDQSIPIAFLALAQEAEPRASSDIVIHSAISLASTTAGIKSALTQMDPAITSDFRAFDEMIRDGLMRDRLMAALSGFFGVLAAMIAAVGLYGVMSYVVVRRTNEIGLRIALGADRGSILSLILGQAGLLLAIGLAVGIALSLAVTGAAQSMLFGLNPHDVRTLMFGAVLLTVVTFTASYLPARRAARLDPMKALREE